MPNTCVVRTLRAKPQAFVLLLFMLLVTLSGCGKVPGISLGGGTEVTPPQQQEPPTNGGGTTTPTTEASGLARKEVLVYYTGPEGAIPGSEAVLKAQASKLSYISGFWYQLDPNTYTDLRTMDNAPEVEIARTVSLAHSLGVKVEALFHNLLYGGSTTSRIVINKLMSDNAMTAKLADNLAKLVQRMQFDGINIDIEYVVPESRQAYTQFVKIVAERLRKDGIRVSVSVPAKTWDDPKNGWAGGYDYAALGALVDRMMLMTYDEHGYSTADGPVASSGWVRDVVRYAVQQVPGNKLLVGLPAYGFDWTSSKSNPVYLDYKQAMVPIQNKLASIQWDAVANVPKYTYTDTSGATHKVWFENASSSSWKLDLVREFGLRGFSLWRAGMEDPALWSVVGQKMRAEK